MGAFNLNFTRMCLEYSFFRRGCSEIYDYFKKYFHHSKNDFLLLRKIGSSWEFYFWASSWVYWASWASWASISEIIHGLNCNLDDFVVLSHFYIYSFRKINALLGLGPFRGKNKILVRKSHLPGEIFLDSKIWCVFQSSTWAFLPCIVNKTLSDSDLPSHSQG